MNLLIVNAGSSSLKLRVLGPDDELLEDENLVAEYGAFDPDMVRRFIRQRCRHVGAVGHRIVHGGSQFSEPTRLDQATMQALYGLVPLAPLHQEVCLRAATVVSDALADVPSVACFDTAFHASLPEEAATYAVPLEWRARWGVRRFGFHGLSHAYAWRRTIELMGHSGAKVRMVTCHLGAGGSLAAVVDGHSVDTTMGFTPLEGLVMATRSGTVDPALVAWLVEEKGVAIGDVSHALEHESGLLALAGSADMAEVLKLASKGHVAARLGVRVYLHRLRAAVAAMASAMGGLDALTFTGGVGENAPELRARTLTAMGFLGISVEHDANRHARPDAEITGALSRVRVFVLRAREDLQIASEVRSVLR